MQLPYSAHQVSRYIPTVPVFALLHPHLKKLQHTYVPFHAGCPVMARDRKHTCDFTPCFSCIRTCYTQHMVKCPVYNLPMLLSSISVQWIKRLLDEPGQVRVMISVAPN